MQFSDQYNGHAGDDKENDDKYVSPQLNWECPTPNFQPDFDG